MNFSAFVEQFAVVHTNITHNNYIHLHMKLFQHNQQITFIFVLIEINFCLIESDFTNKLHKIIQVTSTATANFGMKYSQCSVFCDAKYLVNMLNTV